MALGGLARKILEAEAGGGQDGDKLCRLRASLTPDDRQTVPGRWIAACGDLLSWDDNLLALAERVAGLPTKPLDPAAPEMAAYERQVAAVLRSAALGDR
jgi:hypothetical protein